MSPHILRIPPPYIRKARPRDVPAIVEMVDRTMPDDFRGIVPDEAIARRVSQLGASLKGQWPLALVAEVDGEICGVALVRGVAHLSFLWTSGHRRGAGLGTALMDAVEQQLFAQGHAAITLQVYENNTPAVAFYRSRGWSVTGQHVGEVGAVLLKMTKPNPRKG